MNKTDERLVVMANQWKIAVVEELLNTLAPPEPYTVNGAKVMMEAITKDATYILVDRNWMGNSAPLHHDPYVTWELDPFAPGPITAYMGHYFDSLHQAVDDFLDRAKKGTLNELCLKRMSESL